MIFTNHRASGAGNDRECGCAKTLNDDTAIDRCTTRHEGYRFSQRVGKRVEEVFGWVKTVAGGRKLRYCGVGLNRFWMEMTTASYNLVRLAKLTPVAA